MADVNGQGCVRDGCLNPKMCDVAEKVARERDDPAYMDLFFVGSQGRTGSGGVYEGRQAWRKITDRILESALGPESLDLCAAHLLVEHESSLAERLAAAMDRANQDAETIDHLAGLLTDVLHRVEEGYVMTYMLGNDLIERIRLEVKADA